MSVLEQLHIIALVPEPPVPRAYRLNPSFARSLRQALTGGGSTQSFGVPVTHRSGPEVKIERLDNHAREQWESILYYMVGSTGSGGVGAVSDIAVGTQKLLEWGEFVRLRNGKPFITKAGFEFLLQEPNAQVWNLLIVYLGNSEAVS
jgi:transcription initiation factor TFIIH subunit 4